VNEALLYRHFASKEALFEAAVEGPLEAAVAKLVELSGEPPETFDSSGTVMRERGYQFIYDLLEAMEEIGTLMGVVLFGQADRSAEFFRARIEPALTSIEKVIEANQTAFPHRDFDIAVYVRMVVGSAWFLSATDALSGRKRDRAATAKAMTAVFYEGVGDNASASSEVQPRRRRTTKTR
jgi:AcrR family transcriptional regulator